MADLRDLYQESVLDHYKNPRNFHKLDQSNRQADGFNPLCGDKITISANVENGVIRDIGFSGSGCAISISSASMMTEILKGKTEAEAGKIFQGFKILVSKTPESQAAQPAMGILDAFAGLRDYPVRARCATLAWHTMIAALQRQQETISTE